MSCDEINANRVSCDEICVVPNKDVVICVAVRCALFVFDTVNGLARTMADEKSEVSRIFDVKYWTFLTSKDDFLVAATDRPGNKTFLPI